MVTIEIADNTVFKKELARREFPAYCEYVHGDILKQHFGVPRLCDHLRAWGRELEDEGQDTLIVAPPETWKSNLVRWWMEFCIGRNPHDTMLYVMNTFTQAARQNVSLQDTIQNNRHYRELFPHIRPDKSKGWSNESTFVQRPGANPNPTLFAAGINGPYQGLHPNRIFIDDPTDQQDVRSGTIMSEQVDRVRGVLYDRRQKGGVIKAILTRWGESDLVDTFKGLGFKVLTQPIEDEYPWGNTRLLCPELFPDSRIQDIKVSKDVVLADGTPISSALFQLTYMCRPGAATGTKIKREWWQFYDLSQPPEFKSTVHSWDLSIGRKGGDFSAFGAWGVAENGYYMTDGGRWRLDMDEKVKKMVYLYERDRPRWVLVEDSSVSMDVIEYIKKHTGLPLKPISPGTKDKAARLDAIIAYIEAKRVWLPTKQPWVLDFIDECSRFTGLGDKHDDQVDQMTQALKFLASARSGRISSGVKVRPI
jgi:predicted phage terminase large subunit-like protein